MPTGRVRYDNLGAAARVLGFSRQRVEAERWTAFRSHYGLDVLYRRPGIGGAHEKGGVEGQIGWFRRNHLVPVPEVATLAELNAMIDRWDEEDEARRIRSRPRTIGEYLATERSLPAPLPEETFETGRLSTPRVDRYSQIGVRNNRYSVPVRLIGRTVRVMLHASELVVYDGREEVARHERLIAKGGTGSIWTTTWRPWSASPAPCPGRPRSTRPAPPAASPRSTTPGGRPSARPTASAKAPAR
ncbi:hypothetical protein [Kitasatospora sp. NPDC057198]|uniref:Mu transposase domain-containing protein n=1 Tax=Kitasatospora sp. NPDC057198 TaxID=3346046 RepID=UPI0036440BE5